MSIQSLLELNREKMNERESLDSLARLPQQMIMSMVQRKTIPQTDVPMILSRKAELAQEEANKRALMQQAAQQGQEQSIIEKLMAQNAAAEAAKAPAPEDMTDVGIASNPVPEMRMAGGGIVAFQEGGEAELSEEERERLRQNEYMQRVYGFGDFFSRLGSGIEKYNPFTGTAYRDAIRNFINESPESQAERFRAASPRREQAVNPKQEVPPTSTTQATSSAIPSRSYKEDDAREVARMQATAGVNKRYQDELEAKRTAPPVIPESAGKSEAAKINAEKQGILDEYKKLYAQDKDAADKTREEAKWMRMLEAGLNIMGGESPYAFSNIGKGAAAAAKGYGEDVRGLRAEERERNKQLALLGLKEKELGLEGRKLDITEQRYKDLTNLERQKIGILAQRNLDDKMATGVNNIFAQLMKKYDALLSNGSVTEADLYRQAQEMYTSTTGKGMKGGVTSQPSNKLIGFSDFTGKK